MNTKDFGQRVRKLRIERGMNQTTLARKVGIHYINLSRYEKGKSSPMGDTLARLSRVLGVSMDYLVFGPGAVNHMEDGELFVLFKRISTLPPEDRLDAKKLIGDFIEERKSRGD